MQDRISSCIQDAVYNFERLLADNEVQYTIEQIVLQSISAFNANNKILLCGNGGSAADAQHIASELSGRFYKERDPLYAEALHGNSSYMTAVANDYGYENTYARMIQASGKEGDLLFGLSTSGNSQNIINAFLAARKSKMLTVGLTGSDGGKMNDICDLIIKVPSNDIARIQEGHILIGHIICQLIEEDLF